MLIEDTISIKEMNNCDDLEGWNGGKGERLKREGIYLMTDWHVSLKKKGGGYMMRHAGGIRMLKRQGNELFPGVSTKNVTSLPL